LKRLLLLFTVATMLATLGIGTAAYADNIKCVDGRNCPGTDRDDTITGTDNHNEIRAQGGRDTVYGKGGDDDLYGNGGPDTIYGGTGNDNLYGGGGNDKLYDERGLLTGDPADTDYLYGGAGDDYLNAHDGDTQDWLYGEDGTDYCVGESYDHFNTCEGGEKWTPSGNKTGWDGNNN
jgi:Ca2+-binding RTX toxin-like protein